MAQFVPDELREKIQCPHCGEDRNLLVDKMNDYTKTLIVKCGFCKKKFDPSKTTTLDDFKPELEA